MLPEEIESIACKTKDEMITDDRFAGHQNEKA
jgi:hypothetical protein